MQVQKKNILNEASQLHNSNYDSPQISTYYLIQWTYYDSPQIAIVIGATHIEHALLDLGASINLLPYFVY